MRLALSLMAVVLLAGAAQAQETVRHGKALLQEFCGDCHAVGVWGRSHHTGAPPFRYLGRSYDLDALPRALERGISSDHPDMPEFKFSEDDASDVRAYLRAIQQ
jgi:mono/diheme cytochrome c family protein